MEEFKGRLMRVQSAMRSTGLDALLITTETDFAWFTGFLTPFWKSPTRPWFLVVPVTGLPIAVIPSIGEACMRRSWIDDIRSWPSPRPEDDGVSLLADTLSEVLGDAAEVGLSMGPGTHLRMPVADFERLKRLLPRCHWQDCTGLLVEARAIKSSAECAKIRHVCDLASMAFEELPRHVHLGMSDRELFMRFRCLCLENGVDDVAYLVGCVGAGGYDDIISPPGGRLIDTGDILILDTGCVYDGYYCDFDRNFAIGTADAQAQDAYRIAWEATEAGLDAARPGITCSELFTVMSTVMQPHAIEVGGEVGRLGHGLGLDLTEAPSLMPDDHTELRSGMVMTLEPGFAFAPNKFMVHEENILITPSGCELLSRRAAEQIPVIVQT